MKNTETANVVNAATTEPTVKSVDLAAAVAKQNAAKSVAKKAAKSVAKKAAKPVAKKSSKPVAKKATKLVTKKLATPRASSIFTLTAKAAHEDFGTGQRFAIAKLLKNGATRAQLIAKLPDVPPANISWHLSMFVKSHLAKKTAQK